MDGVDWNSVSAGDKSINDILGSVYGGSSERTKQRHHSALCAFAVFIGECASRGERIETLKEVLTSVDRADRNPTLTRFLREIEAENPALAKNAKAAVNAVRKGSPRRAGNKFERTPDDARTIEDAKMLMREKSTWYAELSQCSIETYDRLMRKLGHFARGKDEDGELRGILFGENKAREHPAVKRFSGDDKRGELKDDRLLLFFLEKFDEARELQRVEHRRESEARGLQRVDYWGESKARALQRVERWGESKGEPGVWEGEIWTEGGVRRVGMDLNFHPDDKEWIDENFNNDE